VTDLERLIRRTRAAFHALAAYGSALHADLGVNASMRAVMEHIEENGPATAPEMARAKGVSRQHIQTIVDLLIDAALAEARTNPEHKRSSLIALTRKGRATIAKIRAREEKALAQLSRRLGGVELAGAEKALAALIAAIDDDNKGENQ